MKLLTTNTHLVHLHSAADTTNTWDYNTTMQEILPSAAQLKSISMSI